VPPPRTWLSPVISLDGEIDRPVRLGTAVEERLRKVGGNVVEQHRIGEAQFDPVAAWEACADAVWPM
jgi:hypothetical protein